VEKQLLTYFAPAERAPIEVIEQQSEKFRILPFFNNSLNFIPSIFAIINKERQIVYANKSLLDYLGFKSGDGLIGKRFGEAINCIHAFELEGGCGTTEYCRNCGAVNAILNCMNFGVENVQETRISINEGLDAVDFRIYANPFEIDGEKFTVLAVKDISDEKRRLALERIFFHDILNTAGTLYSCVEIIKDTNDMATINEFKDILYLQSCELINEIKSQRELLNAENNNLTVELTKINSLILIYELENQFAYNELAKNKSFYVSENCINIDFESDKTLLKRVLGNMIKNAFEDSNIGQVIKIGCNLNGDNIEFWVNNQDEMPRKIQLQIFQRSFSTKEPGRGLGTYSMKLLTERYLKGEVHFTSLPHEGTTFFVNIPVKQS
jgi:PAS domain-containing protein